MKYSVDVKAQMQATTIEFKREVACQEIEQ
jgi:hypothetical protein